jgi:hypothetical protein
LSSVDGDPDSGSTRSADVESGDASSTSGIIQVYAAYESGLANGTSVKLHVTTRTVAREVVDLVVRQLNMAVGLKGKENNIYEYSRLERGATNEMCFIFYVSRERWPRLSGRGV